MSRFTSTDDFDAAQSGTAVAGLLAIDAGAGGLIEPVGANVVEGGVVYRVWAPEHRVIRTIVANEESATPRSLILTEEGEGYFSGVDPEGKAGDLYHIDVDGQPLPDPASRYQPSGVDGPSQVIDPSLFAWQANGWSRPSLKGRVIYELHVGTFTKEGTFLAAIKRLDDLVELGVNTIELMPVADFAGSRNWGYDGVLLFAPARCYGTPEELRMLVDAAHLRGLAVVLDVVYNHLGAVGNVLHRYSKRYFHENQSNGWGQALNFDDDATAVRRFFIQNACMWLDEYRFDGLRLDAVHAIEDRSARHILSEIASAAHARGAFVIGEDERNQVTVLSPASEGGWGFDAVWADDFHHTVRVALTHQKEAHFRSFEGSADEAVDTLRRGWLYEGQYCPHLDAPRGTVARHRPPEQFVHCITNHDQIGNRPLGDRLNAAVSPEAYRALSMLLCLSPYTPMLFMGQEWAASSPFVFFTDLPGEVGEKIAEGRKGEFERYGANYDAETLMQMPDPQDPSAFERSKLDWSEAQKSGHREVLALYKACLKLRAQEPLFQSPPRNRWSVQKVGEDVIGIRWTATEGDWLLLVGLATGETSVTENIFVRNRRDRRWKRIIGSNDAVFGGGFPVAPTGSNVSELRLNLPEAVLYREV
ncbi:MAG: malto-oligosyltrehalose trehalohydrolase [Opitutaceae bacterium]|nr:malto-oligosyltrehalose trehalohydrolase [Opitutaceae bacterium]